MLVPTEFGPHCKAFQRDIYLGQKKVTWTEQVKYTEVTFYAGSELRCDVSSIMHNVYAASNNIFNNFSGLSDLKQLHLQQVYCLPCSCN